MFYPRLNIGLNIDQLYPIKYEDKESKFPFRCNYAFTSLVIGAIVICLFPLWPAQMREYTWYLSVAAAVLLGALLVVALCKLASYDLALK